MSLFFLFSLFLVSTVSSCKASSDWFCQGESSITGPSSDPRGEVERYSSNYPGLHFSVVNNVIRGNNSGGRNEQPRPLHVVSQPVTGSKEELTEENPQ